LQTRIYAKVCSAYKDAMASMQRQWLIAESAIDWSNAFTHRL